MGFHNEAENVAVLYNGGAVEQPSLDIEGKPGHDHHEGTTGAGCNLLQGFHGAILQDGLPEQVGACITRYA